MGALSHTAGLCKMVRPLWKSMAVLQMVKQMTQQLPAHVSTQEDEIHGGIIHNSRKMETTQMSMYW